MAASRAGANKMTPELWQRMKPLFHAALERGTEHRAAFIAAACGDDLELKEHLLQLVEAEEQGTANLDQPLADLSNLYNLESNRFYPGEVVLGRFRIVRQIGRGGMGEVYEAEDLQLGVIALKTIRAGIASSSSAFERFRQEVQLARKVSGPQVCRIHELFLLPASGKHMATAFLTMEYLEGVTLSDKLRSDGALPWKEALNIAVGICEGLHLIHENGVIHRDLKSSNIMLCKHGNSVRTVLMDFGLAHDFAAQTATTDESTVRVSHPDTLPGAIMGTPEYMAPEQFEAKPVSPATDIYALGIVLYELVTGLHPYAAPTPVAAAIRRSHHPASPSAIDHSVPRHFDRIIERCLVYEPGHRFQSADEVAKALRAGPANLNNLREDRPWLFKIAAVLVFAVFAWGIHLWWQTRQYYHPSIEARRWYDTGLSSLREGNYVKATRSFEAAIDRDKFFIMAHARLAEAWADLDFQGNAQRELLIATPEERRLTALDQMYLNAVHATVTGDFPAGVELYRRILNRLPSSEKPSGYVDLGMACERAGDPPKALENYAKAASLDEDNPAPYMHTAVLQSRLHHVPQAEKAFQHAEAIFKTEMNQEGLAELDYERGYAANDVGNSAKAKEYLERSIEEAEKIPSVQLEIRALTQLSSVSYNSDHDSQAVEQAERAIRLARDNQLDSWAANGLVRLANAQLDQGHLQEAQDALQESLQLVHQSPQPRVEALANLTLASLMNQKHQPDQVIKPAQAALAYYKQNGFSSQASRAALLLIRTERDKGQYKQALQDSNELLEITTQSGIRPLMIQAEEVVGTVYFAVEQYPEALVHFQKAKSLADTQIMRSYEALDCADTLWRLGRYAESEALLQTIAGSDDLVTSVGEIRVKSLLSQQKHRLALALAQQVIAEHPKMVSDRQLELEQDEVLAESHLEMKKQVLTDLSAYFVPEQHKDSPEDAAREELSAAEIYLSMGMAEQAHDAAVAAHTYFASSGQLDSELRSACLAAAASKSLNNPSDYDLFSTKVVDILTVLQHTWQPQDLQQYLLRPDLHLLTRNTAKAGQIDHMRSRT